MRRCDCQREKIRNAKLSVIPERFRNANFENYVPVDSKQIAARSQMEREFTGSYFLFGDYARGKTHLATAQYRMLVDIERPCLFMTMAELMSELRRAELSWKPDSANPDHFCAVLQHARHTAPFHLFVDDVDKFKATEFKFEVLFDLVDTIYKRKLGLTMTSNYSLRELANAEVIHPAIVRRIDDICAAVEL